MDWQNLDYLQNGTSRQRAAFRAIRSSGVMEVLSRYRPVLVGTIPLDIDLPESDLDIICEVADTEAFVKTIIEAFGKYQGFTHWQSHINGQHCDLARFLYDGFIFELFGQNLPPERQNAYRHLLVEYRLLRLGGEDFRHQVLTAKRAGFKTEPAFAQLLQLGGNPYDALLTLENMEEQQLADYLRKCRP